MSTFTTTTATEEFDIKHSTVEYGPIYYKDKNTGAERIYFSDGATRECDPFNCALVDPPRDAIDRMRLIANYFKLRFQKYNSAAELIKRQVKDHVEAQLSPTNPYSPHPPDQRLLSELERVVPLRDAAKRDYDKSQMALASLQPKTNLDHQAREYSRRRQLGELLRNVESR